MCSIYPTDSAIIFSAAFVRIKSLTTYNFDSIHSRLSSTLLADLEDTTGSQWSNATSNACFINRCKVAIAALSDKAFLSHADQKYTTNSGLQPHHFFQSRSSPSEFSIWKPALWCDEQPQSRAADSCLSAQTFSSEAHFQRAHFWD